MDFEGNKLLHKYKLQDKQLENSFAEKNRVGLMYMDHGLWAINAYTATKKANSLLCYTE